MVNDPAQRKLLKQDRPSFEREWSAAGKWTLLALPQTDPADLQLLFLSISSVRRFCCFRRRANFGRPACPSRPSSCSPNSAGRKLSALGKSARTHSADLDFYYGTALAQLGRLARRSACIRGGSHGCSHSDKRFPSGAGWSRFQSRKTIRGRPATCVGALRISIPRDSYGNDFLGTVYFLQGNIEAALKYWNRVGKPHIAEVRTAPAPQVNAALLDRALAFAPASVVASARSADHRNSGPRTGNFLPAINLICRPRDDGKFDILFRNRERDGWGQTQAGKAVPAVSRTAVSEHHSRGLQPAASGHQLHFHVSLGRGEAPGFRANSQVRSRGIRNSATDCWPTCAAKTGTSGIRFRARLRCWEVSTCGGKPWAQTSRLSRADDGAGLREPKFRIAISAA